MVRIADFEEDVLRFNLVPRKSGVFGKGVAESLRASQLERSLVASARWVERTEFHPRLRSPLRGVLEELAGFVRRRSGRGETGPGGGAAWDRRLLHYISADRGKAGRRHETVVGSHFGR